MIRTAWPAMALLMVLALPPAAAAVPVTLDFEGLADSIEVTDQFAAQGVIVENAFAATIGVSIDPFEFEAASGQNVLVDAGVPMRLLFGAAPIFSFSGLFTYGEPLTISGYLGGSLVASVLSQFDANFISTGNAPNELLGLQGLFDEIRIAGIEFGGFTMDDLTFDTEPSSTPSVPEPGTLALVALGGGLLLRRRRRASR